MRGYLALALSLYALAATAAPLTRSEHAIIMTLADVLGVPRSVADRLQIEESGDPLTGAWGDASKVGKAWPHCLGLYQLNPQFLAWFLARFYPHPAKAFDWANPLDNAVVALGYLAALHRQYGTWYLALAFYNCGRVTDVPESTREYARRIVEWNKE